MYKTILWEDVSDIKFRNLWPIKYMLVYTAASRWALWVPLNIKNSTVLLHNMAQSDNKIVYETAKELNQKVEQRAAK